MNIKFTKIKEKITMKFLNKRIIKYCKNINENLGNSGMEMIQVAIILGLIFKSEITSFVNKTFSNLNNGF